MEMQSQDIGELMKALSQAQGEIKIAAKDSKNPFFKSNYADLGSVKEASQEALTKYKLAVVQSPMIVDGIDVLVTTLGHESGQYIKSMLRLNPVKNDPQAMGSAITYARRYALAAMIGVVADVDDDGEAATGRDNKPQYAPKPQPLVAKPQLSASYNATDEHKRMLLDAVRSKGFDPAKLDLKKISEDLIKKGVKLADMGDHIA